MVVRFFSPQLVPHHQRTSPAKDPVFVCVMRYRTSIAPQPFPECPQVLFRTVVLCETCIETAGGIIDHRNQLTSRPKPLQPAKRRTILHHQLSETGAALAPHMDGLYALRAGAPQAS